MLANDIIGFHTRSYRWNFLQCCRDLWTSRSTSRKRHRVLRGPRGVGARVPAADRRGGDVPRPRRRSARRSSRRSCWRRRREHMILRVDRADLSKNVLRGFSRLRPVPRAAPRVPREGHVHRAAHAVADRRARVRRVPRAHRGAGRGRQPPPRHAGLDADPAQAARRPRGGDGLLQALRRADGQRDVRRDEPRGEGGPARQRAQRRLGAVARTPARTRSSASTRCRSTRSTSRRRPTRSTRR